MTKQTDNLSDNLADLLHVQGINCKGFDSSLNMS